MTISNLKQHLLVLLLLKLSIVSAATVFSEAKYLQCDKTSCGYVYSTTVSVNPFIEDSITLSDTNITFHTNTLQYIGSPKTQLFLPQVTPYYKICVDCKATWRKESTSCKCSYPNSTLISAKNFKPTSLHKCDWGKDGVCLAVSLAIGNLTCYYYDWEYAAIITSIDFNGNYDSETHITYYDGSYEKGVYNNYVFEYEDVQLIKQRIDEYHCLIDNHWYRINYDGHAIDTDPLSILDHTSVFKDSKKNWKTKYVGYNYELIDNVQDRHYVYQNNPENPDGIELNFLSCDNASYPMTWFEFKSWITDIDGGANVRFLDYDTHKCHTTFPITVLGLNGMVYKVTTTTIEATGLDYQIIDYLPLTKLSVVITTNFTFEIKTYLDNKCAQPTLSCIINDDSIKVYSNCNDGIAYIDYAHTCQITDGSCIINTKNGQVKLMGTSLVCKNTYETDAITGWANGIFSNTTNSRTWWQKHWFTCILIISIILIISMFFLCHKIKRNSWKTIKYD